MEKTDKKGPRKRSFFATLIAVAWSFIGLRRKKDYEEDVSGLNPVHVIAAALLGAALFIGTLVAIVHWVVP